MSKLFDELVKAYAEMEIEFPQLKGITVAQWLLESGRGTSRLAVEHFNFGGLKWRSEMTGFATPVDYQAHDGLDKYCKFAGPKEFIKGYWRFLDRSPYAGWRDKVNSPEEFIRFIAPTYAGDPNYASKVLNLLDEVNSILAGVDQENPPQETDELIEKPAIKAFYQSPNCSSRAGSSINMIVLHYTTADNFQSTKNWFLNPVSQVSAHYVIDKNGDIYQMVLDSDNAWHAGNKPVNRSSIGIEHVAKAGDRLTKDQEKSSVQLIKWLMAEYRVPKENVKAHKEIKSTSCPGTIFGDEINDINLPKFKKWIADNFSGKPAATTPEEDGSEVLSPSGLGIYIVRPGDTFSKIADRHDISLKKLRELNPNIENFDLIFPGQKIIVARVEGDEDLITDSSRALNLPITIAESQLTALNYQDFSHPVLGDIKITGGFMEPHGHSLKPQLKAIFLDGTLKTLASSRRNIGIDYVVSNRKVRAWYGGTVTRRGREGGYGRRLHLQLNVTYEFEGKKYQVYQAFAHLQEILVGLGQEVLQGEQIAIMGGSGTHSDHDYPPHVDLSTYIIMNGAVVQLNPQALDRQLS